MAQKITSKTTTEPVSLQEMKVYLRIDHDADNDLIAKLIATAREAVELATNRQLTATTLEVQLDHFPVRPALAEYTLSMPLQVPLHTQATIPLPTPLTSVSSIQFRDTNEQWQTLAPSKYVVDIAGGRVEITDTPDISEFINPVTITCVVGSTCNFTLKQLIKFLVADMYENRSATVGPLHENPTYARILWLNRDVSIA